MTQTHTQTFAIFGATGGTGRALLERALDDGHRIRALSRDASRLDPHPRLEVIEGDVMDPAAVRATVRGTDAVFIALGAPALSKSRVRSEGTAVIIEAMNQEGIERVVTCSLLGAHESKESLTFFLRYVLFPLYLRRAVADHERQETLLAASGLQSTVVRPPHLDDGPARGEYVTGFTDLEGLTVHISRADLAAFMLEEALTGRHVGQAVAISDRKASAPALAAA